LIFILTQTNTRTNQHQQPTTTRTNQPTNKPIKKEEEEDIFRHGVQIRCLWLLIERGCRLLLENGSDVNCTGGWEWWCKDDEDDDRKRGRRRVSISSQFGSALIILDKYGGECGGQETRFRRAVIAELETLS